MRIKIYQAVKELESKCTNPDCTAERAHSGPCPPKNFGEFLRTKLNDRYNEDDGVIIPEVK